jgi:acetylornithine deacetylase/succinyl-diaminopimelate desuccinylase-like protein
MTRDAAIARAYEHFDTGAFRADLARRVAIPTESQNPARAPELVRYLEEEMRPELERMGFAVRLIEEPNAKGPFLFAERIEDPGLPTVFGYGHGDVIRGLDESWEPGLSPWTMTERGDRWYGRGVVDNKGQHAINLAAQAAVLAERGRLGFNAKWLIETGEETGSPGLREVCARHKDLFASDVLIGSDGPRLNQDRPTVFLGSRGGASFDLWIDAREGGHHSGNWGGLLSNPAIQLAHALASLVGPTGQIRVHELVPKHGLPENVRRALADCELETGPGAPTIDPTWGEPGLTGPEKVFGWCALEILAMEAGVPKTPVNAVPPRAWARCQLRFVVDVDMNDIVPAVRRHLDRHGFGYVQVAPAREEVFPATRLDPDNPWVHWALASIERTTGKTPALLPNLGGSLPNDAFSEILGLPTVWVPHSYPGCSQHAPNEHVPVALVREALGMMAGLYWDVAESGIGRRG